MLSLVKSNVSSLAAVRFTASRANINVFMDPAGDLGAADDRRALLAYGQSQYAQRNYANALTAFTTVTYSTTWRP